MKQVTCPFCETKFPPRSNYTDPIYEEKSSHQVEVEKFMKLGGQEVPPSPTIPSLEVRRLRAKLIFEEALETIHALGLIIIFSDCVNSDEYATDSLHKNFKYEIVGANNPILEQIVDGCCDLRVVTTGTLSACGIKDLQPQEMVDANNLEKFKWTPEDIKKFVNENDRSFSYDWQGKETCVVRNKDGKIIKPPSHKPPSLDKEIFRQEQKYSSNSKL